MDLKILPGALRGKVDIQPSKSVAHRYAILSALAKGDSRLHNMRASEDICATLGALNALGLAQFTWGEALNVRGGLRGEAAAIDCNESGSTLRFLLPLSLLFGGGVFAGKGRLLQRPMGPYEALFKQKGIDYKNDGERITVRGMLEPGEFILPGDVSSQFISGLLMALPVLGGQSKITLTTPLESRGYVDITLRAMREFGARVETMADGYSVNGAQAYKSGEYTAEGDWSHAAFFLVANALGSQVECAGLREDSVQGDRAIAAILRAACADAKRARVPIKVDMAQVPDLFPILAVLACGIKGESVLCNARRLRLKESDRLGAMAHELRKLGADLTEHDDALVVRGSGTLTGGEVHGHNDHRVVMALAMASCIASGPVVIRGCECVKKSAPDFWDEFARLGGRASAI